MLHDLEEDGRKIVAVGLKEICGEDAWKLWAQCRMQKQHFMFDVLNV